MVNYNQNPHGFIGGFSMADHNLVLDSLKKLYAQRDALDIKIADELQKLVPETEKKTKAIKPAPVKKPNGKEPKEKKPSTGNRRGRKPAIKPEA
jgi:hypothetical protein